jgi:hypothetical protein
VIRSLIFSSIIFFALAANGQEAITISPVVSFDLGAPLFINRAQGVIDPIGGNTATFTSLTESYGLGLQFMIPNVFAKHIGLLERVEGVYTTGRFSFGTPAYSVSGIDRDVLFEIGAFWDIHPFSISAAPWISEAISRTVYENDPNGTQIASGEGIASVATHFGFSAGLGWNIPNLPLRAELNGNLDLTELSQAGANALTAGISLIYTFGGKDAPAPTITQTSDSGRRAEAPAAPVVPAVTPRVRFLVNGAEANGNPPLERVEMRVKEYAMVDSANVPPRVTKWAEESYRLPHLSLVCRFDRRSAGYLMILKDSLRLMEKYFGGNSDAFSDTTIDLESDDSWNTILSHLNTNESNRLVAELRTNREQLSLSCDTLLLPPVDTTRAVQTIEKKQARFILHDDYRNVEGGEESLELLLAKIDEMLAPTASINIIESAHAKYPALYSDLKQRLLRTLGKAWTDSPHEEGVGESDSIVIVLKY